MYFKWANHMMHRYISIKLLKIKRTHLTLIYDSPMRKDPDINILWQAFLLFATSWLSSTSKCVKRFHFLSLLKLQVAMWLSLADKTWVEVVYVTSGWKYLIAGSYLSSVSFPAVTVEEEVSCKCSSVERLKW